MIVSKKKLNNLVNIEPVKVIKAEETALQIDMNRIVAAEYSTTDVFLISGPSASGKTTFATRLADKLDALKISLDDFYVDRVDTPLDEDGNYDFECIEAIRVNDFQKTIRALLEGKAVTLPIYDFVSGTHHDSEPVELNGKKIVVEGLHALNPIITRGLNITKTKIFVHVDTSKVYDSCSAKEQRLLRRICRDTRDRGRTVQQTIDAVDSVARGENIWIYPYKSTADYIINTYTLYETAALAEVLKNCDHPWVRTHLDGFNTINTNLIPQNAICREFIGQ